MPTLSASQKFKQDKEKRDEEERIQKEKKRVEDEKIKKQKMIDDFNKKRDEIFSFVIASKDTETKK